MSGNPFWDYWYFHIPNYLAAVVIYTLIGRLLALRHPPRLFRGAVPRRLGADRGYAMTPRGLFVAVLCVSLFNGLTSPALLLVRVLAPIWMPQFLPASPGVQFYFASVIVSFGTLLLAGLPAALYEQLRRQRSSDGTSLMIWLGAAILLSLPGAQQFLRATAA